MLKCGGWYIFHEKKLAQIKVADTTSTDQVGVTFRTKQRLHSAKEAM